MRSTIPAALLATLIPFVTGAPIAAAGDATESGQCLRAFTPLGPKHVPRLPDGERPPGTVPSLANDTPESGPPFLSRHGAAFLDASPCIHQMGSLGPMPVPRLPNGECPHGSKPVAGPGLTTSKPDKQPPILPRDETGVDAKKPLAGPTQHWHLGDDDKFHRNAEDASTEICAGTPPGDIHTRFGHRQLDGTCAKVTVDENGQKHTTPLKEGPETVRRDNSPRPKVWHSMTPCSAVAEDGQRVHGFLHHNDDYCGAWWKPKLSAPQMWMDYTEYEIETKEEKRDGMAREKWCRATDSIGQTWHGVVSDDKKYCVVRKLNHVIEYEQYELQTKEEKRDETAAVGEGCTAINTDGETVHGVLSKSKMYCEVREVFGGVEATQKYEEFKRDEPVIKGGKVRCSAITKDGRKVLGWVAEDGKYCGVVRISKTAGVWQVDKYEEYKTVDGKKNE